MLIVGITGPLGKALCAVLARVKEGTRTPDPQNHNLVL